MPYEIMTKKKLSTYKQMLEQSKCNLHGPNIKSAIRKLLESSSATAEASVGNQQKAKDIFRGRVKWGSSFLST